DIQDCTQWDSIALIDAWEAAEATAPRLDALASTRQALSLDIDVHRRERLPRLAVTLQGDVGQRARPGEERALGPGGRGDVGALIAWPLFESERRALGQYLESLGEEADQRERLERSHTRLEITASYIEAHASIEAVDHLFATRQATRALVDLVQARVEEQVEAPYALMVIEQRHGQLDRELRRATARRDRALLELSNLAGRCVSPAPLAQTPEPMSSSVVAETHSLLKAQHHQAAALQARAEAIRRAGLFDVTALGVAGLYGSRVFENRVQPDYYAGLTMTWRPDWTGIRRLQSQAEIHRGRALLEEVQATRQDLERELDALVLDFDELQALLTMIEAHATAARERQRVAQHRFEAGVETLTQLIEAHQALSELLATRLDHQAAMHILGLRVAATTDTWERLPGWLGQPGDGLP
ncbi:MAG: TolC family protein, partial [Bradymonadaceae bacterium]